MKLSIENKLKNKILFLTKAREIFGERYDYSIIEKSNGFNLHDKVEIICKIHGSWLVKATYHINKNHGCPLCARNDHKSTKDKFIANAIKIHGTKYDYSKVVYEFAIEKIIIGCFIHGDFLQTPNSHLGGRGCPKCGRAIVEEAHKTSNEHKIKIY